MKYLFLIFLILLITTACVNTVKPVENKENSAAVEKQDTQQPETTQPAAPETGSDYNIGNVFDEEEVEPPIIPA